MSIVVISGLPCSGKSKLAERLQAQWRRPLFAKDAFKEALFDSLGTGDRAWSRRLSAAAYAVLFQQTEALLYCGIDCIVEGNFREREHRDRFAHLRRAGATFIQIHCRAAPEILTARFRERALSGRRHAGHVDSESLPEIESELLTSPQEPLGIAGSIIECDTTDDWQSAIERTIQETLVKLAK